MKSNNKAIFHIIVTQLGWGLFLALNARRPLRGGVSCMPAVLLCCFLFQVSTFKLRRNFIEQFGSKFEGLLSTQCAK